MKKLIFLFSIVTLAYQANSQNVGIGTTSPRQSAVLDINSTNKGVLFPRLTYAQILNISNPANGLHVFNTDVNSLQFYDSTQTKWVSYSNDITEYQIKSNEIFSLSYPLNTRVIMITVYQGVYAALDLFDFSVGAPPGTKIILLNYGNIIGKQGKGGRGGTHESCTYTYAGSAGQNGGHAIVTGNNIDLIVFNYGFIAGGGGGGGGGGYANGQFASTNFGGGGGTGRGLSLSFGTYGSPHNLSGGDPGWAYCSVPGPGNASYGNPGNLTGPGTGGAGTQGGIFNTGGTGGSGSGYAQTGLVGTGALPGAGGAGGKAIALYGGGTNYSNTVTNIGAGQVIGVVD